MTTYDQLVAAATVGVAQRPIAIDALPGAAAAHAGLLDPDPAAAVLGAAALLDAARRAGGLAPTAVTLPEPAADDTAPELNRVAGDLFRGVLAGGDRELLAELLDMTAAAGARIPAPDLPALLSVAAAQRALRSPTTAVLGARGHWLALQHPDWRRVVDASAAIVPPDAWETGRPAERVAWLGELRRRDPQSARETLLAGWGRETGDDRAALLAVLAGGLSAADEPFLESALDDRRAEVRGQARALLARLTGSAFAARATARARGVLRIERRGLRRRIVVTPPEPPDAAARRDGHTVQPPMRGVGERAWHLFQVVARAPLDLWPATLGIDPVGLAALDVAGEFGNEVRAAWQAAAIRERDAGWAQALLAHPAEGPLASPAARLAALLPAPARVARAVAVLAGAAPRSIADVAVCPGPWPVELTDALLGYLGAQCRSATPTMPGELPGLAARRIDLADRRDLPGWLRELADRFRVRTATVPTAGRWAAPLERAADTLELRRRFSRELQ